MPRKVRVPVPKDKSRETQQRSRARHREYVADLEKRIRAFEREGIQATVEVQHAARMMAIKNERLLALLALHGVQQEEIDTFLADDAESGDANKVPSQSSTSDATAPGPESAHCLAHIRRLQSNTRNDTLSQGNPSGHSLPASHRLVCKPISGQAQDTTIRHEMSSRNATNETTSCEAAATIIASLRGHGDIDEARQTLGCGDKSSCSVKNMDLFQLMNEVP
ncbi:uncharacterized protein JN550_001406 [Neoarthrinium moseri]|uniref:uncharacterized protein n=1 Tax=Neoarthrinium moseri TaxID=1658444 RepID=UPI001FDCF963|nr:uncharacterized protein JN550_001406 [Neoarthrinium moseri]KAI1875910.1 hypothetical protein JN550_001406 [Neoarthrinium moseri]